MAGRLRHRASRGQVIGAWVALGLCLILLLAGMSKIDQSLYEAARIDGAGPVREFFSITIPGVRQELAVCVIVTVIWAPCCSFC